MECAYASAALIAMQSAAWSSGSANDYVGAVDMQTAESTSIIETALYAHPSQTRDTQCTAEARQEFIVTVIFLLPQLVSTTRKVRVPRTRAFARQLASPQRIWDCASGHTTTCRRVINVEFTEFFGVLSEEDDRNEDARRRADMRDT